LTAVVIDCCVGKEGKSICKVCVISTVGGGRGGGSVGVLWLLSHLCEDAMAGRQSTCLMIPCVTYVYLLSSVFSASSDHRQGSGPHGMSKQAVSCYLCFS